MIDSHLHLVQYPLAELDALIEQWRAGGVEQVVAVSTDLRSSHQTLAVKQRHPDFVHAAIGLHPEQAVPSAQELLELQALIRQERPLLSAIGEVGLPHYALPELGEGAVPAHAEMLREFAALSAEQQLPLVLHAVHDKAQMAFDILREAGAPRAHFHWLKAAPDVLASIVQAGHFVSVTPEVCYRERDQQLAVQVPLGQLLVETDGPWPYEERFKGRMTTPLFLKEVVRTVAVLKGVTVTELLDVQRESVSDLYGRIGE